jgi:multidrug transporter EmrE-like cation transporter
MMPPEVTLPASKMTTQVLLLVCATSLAGVTANLLLRHGLVNAGGLDLRSDGVLGLAFRLLRQWTFVVGFLAYGLAALIWFKVLSIAEVSSSYPIQVGLTFTLVTIGAILLFCESISVMKIVGIGVILLGILLIAKS